MPPPEGHPMHGCIKVQTLVLDTLHKAPMATQAIRQADCACLPIGALKWICTLPTCITLPGHNYLPYFLSPTTPFSHQEWQKVPCKLWVPGVLAYTRLWTLHITVRLSPALLPTVSYVLLHQEILGISLGFQWWMDRRRVKKGKYMLPEGEIETNLLLCPECFKALLPEE